jgi:hypothetical protein
MRSLLRAEWLRQRRRPDLWLLPVVVVLAAAWGWHTGLTAAEHSLDMPPGFPVAPDEEVAKLRDPYAFPAGFHAILTGGFLAFIAMVHYGASWTGSEFVRGTIRNIFLVHPARLPFIAVRLAALAMLALVFVVVFVAVAAAMPALRGIAPSPAATPPSLAGLAVYAVAGWFALWFLALGATTLSVVLRSAASAILLIFGYVLAELVVGNAPIWQEVGQLAWLPELLPVGRLLQGLTDVAVATGFSQASAGEASPPVIVPPVVGLVILAERSQRVEVPVGPGVGE